jgi:mycothiol synthase
MLRRDLKGLPAIELPEGYTLSPFRRGWGKHWTRIISESFDGDPGKFPFQRIMGRNPAFRPGRIFFIRSRGTPIATASAWHVRRVMAGAGVLHYVGVVKKHQGRRLGHWVSLAALRRMRAERRQRATLQTDDFRIPAIQTYLRLGFEPLIVHENQRQRWRRVFRAMGRPELCRRFAANLSSPVWTPGTSLPGTSYPRR